VTSSNSIVSSRRPCLCRSMNSFLLYMLHTAVLGHLVTNALVDYQSSAAAACYMFLGMCIEDDHFKATVKLNCKAL
jgi:hypothetical protein